MALFLKKGIDKAKDKYIYPHPTQTGTGNCAAYAGASCFYAFGLDHEPKLIPPAEGGTPGEQFQFQISKMVERLTDLIYTQKNSEAEGYRKYIDEVGLNCKFDVTEEPLTTYEYDHIAGTYKYISNLQHILEELKRCQDIIPFIRWGGAVWNPFRKTYRHAVGLVGVDEGTGELTRIRKMPPRTQRRARPPMLSHATNTRWTLMAQLPSPSSETTWRFTILS
jgi:hypothetical protein